MASAHDLIAASDAALRAFESGDYADRDTAERRMLDAYDAAVKARPSTAADAAAWLRWALKGDDEGGGAIRGSHLEMPATLAHIADQLEAMAGRAAA